MGKVRYRRKQFDVYLPEETDDAGIIYIQNWRDAEKGDWILTDDGKVLEVLERREYSKENQKKPTVYIITGYGKTSTYSRFIFAKPCKHYDKAEDIIYDVKPTVKQREVVEFLLEHGVIDEYGRFKRESLIDAWMSAYRENNPNTALFRAKKLLKKTWVRNIMSKRMQTEFEKIDIDDSWLAKEFKDLYSSSKPGSPGRHNILKTIASMIGALEKEDGDGDSQTYGLPEHVLNELEASRKFLALVRTKISDVGDGKMIIDAEFTDSLVSLINQSGFSDVKKEYRELPPVAPGHNESEE